MAVMDTHISWCDSTWNPTTGCTKVSPGCDHCYAEALTRRLWGGKFEEVSEHPNRLAQVRKFGPIREPDGRLRPRLVFVNSMSDLFHEEIGEAFRHRIFDAMEAAPSTIFQCLTKRPHIMARVMAERFHGRAIPDHIWLGASVEDERFSGRLRILRAMKDRLGDFTAFASVEPLIGPCRLLDLHGIDWVLTGGESGPKCRPMRFEWLVYAHRRAREAGAAIHFKQYGHPRNNPLVQARMRADPQLSPAAAFKAVVAEGLELAPEEKGGATFEGQIIRERPPSFYRLEARLNQQPRFSLQA